MLQGISEQHRRERSAVGYVCPSGGETAKARHQALSIVPLDKFLVWPVVIERNVESTRGYSLTVVLNCPLSEIDEDMDVHDAGLPK